MHPIVPYSHSEAHLSGPTSSLTELALMVCLEQLSRAGCKEKTAGTAGIGTGCCLVPVLRLFPSEGLRQPALSVCIKMPSWVDLLQ